MPEPSENQVVQEVLDEVKKFGESSRKNYDELRKNYEELKHTLEEQANDPLAAEKINKLAEDISTRQKALEEQQAKSQEEFNKRADAIETAMGRPGRSGTKESEELEREAKQFQTEVLSSHLKSDSGVAFEELEGKQFSVEDYQLYRKAFEAWVRKYGGTRSYNMPEKFQKALQVGIDPDGGITVPTSMSNRIIQRIYESDPVRQLATVENITTGAIEWMVDIDEAGIEWEGESTGETTTGGETSTPGWRKKRIVAHTLSAKPRATQTLLEDSGLNIENWLADKLAKKFLRGEGAAFVSGDGVGKPRGFLSYSSGTEWGQVEQVAMGAAAALTADACVNLEYSLKEHFLERGVWLMNRTTVRDAMKLKDSTGAYIWKPSLLASDPVSSLLNLPVRMATTMPAVAANALSVAIADWAEAYMIVDRLGISIQRDPYTAKPFIEFYTRKRVGGDVTNFDAIKIGKISV